MQKITKYLFSLILLSFSIYSYADQTLVYCADGSPFSFNSAIGSDNKTYDASAIPIYNRLVEFKLGTTELQPSLAESWEISPDGKEYIIHLRPNVKFHTKKDFVPTRDLNADDVIFTFTRMSDREHPFYKTSSMGFPMYRIYFENNHGDKLIDKIEKIDDLTLRFVLKKPKASFLALLSLPSVSIYSAEYAAYLQQKGTLDKIDTDPVGTGPFEFIAYMKDSKIRYKAFAQYWKGKSKLDWLIFVITPEASTRYAKIRKGECHIMPSPSVVDLDAIRKNDNLILLERPSLNVGYLAFNVEKEPLNQQKVRQALAMAVDKQAIISAVYHGNAQQAVTFVAPKQWSFNSSIKDYPFDLAKAKQLLTEAGYPDGFKIKLWASVNNRSHNPNGRKTAEIIKADWEKIGVDADIISYEWGEYLANSSKGMHEALLFGAVNRIGDPDNTYPIHASCNAVELGTNRARWCDPQMDTIINQASEESDHAKRVKLYETAQEIMFEQVPAVPIAHTNVYEVIRKNVKNYVVDPFGFHYFDQVSLD